MSYGTLGHEPSRITCVARAGCYISCGVGIWEFPKIRGTFLGVPIIRIIIYWGLYWGPLILGHHYLLGGLRKEYARVCR